MCRVIYDFIISYHILSYHISSNDFVLLSVCASGNEVIWIISYSPTVRSTAGREICSILPGGCSWLHERCSWSDSRRTILAGAHIQAIGDGFRVLTSMLIFWQFSLDPDDLTNVSFSLDPDFLFLEVLIYVIYIYIVCTYCIYGNIYTPRVPFHCLFSRRARFLSESQNLENHKILQYPRFHHILSDLPKADSSIAKTTVHRLGHLLPDSFTRKGGTWGEVLVSNLDHAQNHTSWHCWGSACVTPTFPQL